MAVGRRFSSSSFGRYYIKMQRRFAGIDPGTSGISFVVSYNVSANWLNGYAPFSELRYKILPILAKYGIPRSLAYGFMAVVQHAYKLAVKKQDATPDALFDEAVRILIGNEKQSRFWGSKVDDVFNALRDIFGLIGLNVSMF